MADYRKLLRTAREGTEPSPASIEALQARLSKPSRRAAAWPKVAGGAALLLAAVVLLSVWPAPRVDRSLDHVGNVALGSRVQVVAEGEGHADGNAENMELTWFSGTLGVEVEPNRGVRLSVHTPEGNVRVVGTGFDVTRNALGTAVSVRHGKVAVDCARGGAHTLEAGQSAMCLPTTAAGSLARALAQRESASPDDVEAELNEALLLPDATGPVAAELHALRAGSLLAAGDDDAALVEAEATLAMPEVTRADELHRLAARLRVRRGDCAGALPHLRALEAAGTLGEDAPALADCAP